MQENSDEIKEIEKKVNELLRSHEEKQELIIRKRIDEIEDRKFERLTKAAALFGGAVGVSLVAFLGWASTQMEEAAKLSAKEVAGEVAKSELKKISAEKTILETALNSVTEAQDKAITARTIAETVLRQSQKALDEIEKKLAQIRGAEELMRLLQDTDEARPVIEKMLREPETLNVFTTALEEYHLPPGVIIAFAARSADDSKCPKGWSIFPEAIGRMIVGAGDPRNSPYPDGLSERKAWTPVVQPPGPETIGGAEAVTLTVAQMPSHNHGMSNMWSWQVRGFSDEHAVTNVIGISGSSPFGGETVHAGGDQPHNNMPPYIALYFCRKD